MNTCIGFAAALLGIYAVRYVLGRRSIIIYGLLFGGFSHLAYGIAESTSSDPQVTGYCIVAFMIIWGFSYNISISPGSYVVATEVVNSRLRSWTVGTATALGQLVAWLTSFCTPYFINPTALNWVRIPHP
jgi:hypothetical protein